MRDSSNFPSSFSLQSHKRVVVSLLVATGFCSAACAQVATTTVLSISTPLVAVGVPALLTATVTDANSHTVSPGTVTFYDGSRNLGSAQIVARSGGAYPEGTANLKTASFSPGTNSITAVFAATLNDLTSTSSAVTVTVTGKNATAMSLSVSGGQGDYALTTGLHAFGTGLPTGNVDFLNAYTSTALGSLPLSGATFTPDLSISGGPFPGGPGGLATGDFNGDGFLDLVTSNGGEDYYVELGQGDGTFKTGTSGVVFRTLSVHVGDFNNDGKLDLAFFVFANANPVVVFLGNGDGTFQRQVGYGPQAMSAGDGCVGDFNRDGNLDIAITDLSGHVAIFLGNGDGTFQTEKTYATDAVPAAIRTGDVNGDGILDLVVTADGSAKVDVLLGKGDGTFAAAEAYPFGESNGAPYNGGGPYIAVGDMNGDGVADVVLAKSNSNSIYVALGSRGGALETPVVYSVGETPGQPVIADINQDGKADIALPIVGSDPSFGSTTGTIEVLLGNGNGTFQPATTDLSGLWDPQFMVSGDFNGDGRPDLVTGNFEQYVALNGQTATLQLAGVDLPETGPVLLEASYPGDGSFAASASLPTGEEQYTVNYAGGFAAGGAGLQLNNGATIAGSTLELTNGGMNEATSAFASTPVNVQTFSTDFVFTIGPVSGLAGDGFTFTLQNTGPGAVGGLGGGLGYEGIHKSVAIKFDIYNNAGEGTNSTGLYIDGAAPTVPAVQIPISTLTNSFNLRSGAPIEAHISYNGTYLTLTLTAISSDSGDVSPGTWSYSWPVNIPAAVGGTTAYAGFTGATGGRTSTETISLWSYTGGPAGFLDPANLQFNGSAGVGTASNVWPGTVLLTQGGTDEAGSVFYKTPQNVQAFATDFSFIIYNPSPGGGPSADGFTFTIQNAGASALGGLGGALGYKGIPKSVAVKFDLFNDAGEGNNSTGLYIDGAKPTVPAIDLTPSGLNLHAAPDEIFLGPGGFETPFATGDTFEAHMTYDGTNLTLTIVDLSFLTNGMAPLNLSGYSNVPGTVTFTYSWPIDIPSTVGGTTAYVGFTGGTGGLVSQDGIFSWTYLPAVQ
jgi:Legume lectin domain/Bacterial Ig-like domain (group 3)/FG-GAP-like repeat/Bacterial lectin